MAIVNANNLQIYLGSDSTRASTTTGAAGERIPIANAQTVSLDFTNSLIDVTSKDSASWMEKISGQRSYSLSADGLTDYASATDRRDTNAIGALALAGTQVYYEFGIGDSRYVGTGFTAGFGQSGGTDDAPTFSVSIEGTGPLTFDTDVTS